MTQAFTQGEPSLVNDPIDVSSGTTFSLPETLSLPSTPSLTQISQFSPNFPTSLDARFRETSTNNIYLRLDWNTFVTPPPLFGQYHESNRLHIGYSKIINHPLSLAPPPKYDSSIFTSPIFNNRNNLQMG